MVATLPSGPTSGAASSTRPTATISPPGFCPHCSTKTRAITPWATVPSGSASATPCPASQLPALILAMPPRTSRVSAARSAHRPSPPPTIRRARRNSASSPPSSPIPSHVTWASPFSASSTQTSPSTSCTATPSSRRRPCSNLVEHEERAGHQTAERGRMVPVQPVAKIEHAEHAKHAQRDHFLDHLQLIRRKRLRANPVRRHLQAVLKKRNRPAHQDHLPQRHTAILQVSVPRERHKDVRPNQQQYRPHIPLGCTIAARPMRT